MTRDDRSDLRLVESIVAAERKTGRNVLIRVVRHGRVAESDRGRTTRSISHTRCRQTRDFPIFPERAVKLGGQIAARESVANALAIRDLSMLFRTSVLECSSRLSVCRSLGGLREQLQRIYINRKLVL